MNEETMFQKLASRFSEEPAASLERACGGWPELRRAVEALLRAHDQSGNVLDQPRVDPVHTVAADPGQSHPDATVDHTPGPDATTPSGTTTTDFRPTPEAGIVISGRYTLEEKIGEGGMGEVWVARQTEPVKRRVALKLVKTGMDSTAVLARFEQERQALAIMDHPNIARVLDGGLTPTGQPLFVMELVNGLPLTEFCDQAKLTNGERLELFVPIWQAVQHAASKGHRRPRLEAGQFPRHPCRWQAHPPSHRLRRGQGDRRQTDRPIDVNTVRRVLGTLEYMSPEQAGFSSVDVDTLADIYSLGVILYELLTGLPHRRETPEEGGAQRDDPDHPRGGAIEALDETRDE